MEVIAGREGRAMKYVCGLIRITLALSLMVASTSETVVGVARADPPSVRVQAPFGVIACDVTPERVLCDSNYGFAGAPPPGGSGYSTLAGVTKWGGFWWNSFGPLPSCGCTPTVLPDGSNQEINGWGVQAGWYGLTFVSDYSAKGMFVSVKSTHAI